MAQNKTSESMWQFFIVVLQLIFITLKLCSVINWSWWWVLTPIWGPVGLVIAILLIWVIFEALQYGINWLFTRKK